MLPRRPEHPGGREAEASRELSPVEKTQLKMHEVAAAVESAVAAHNLTGFAGFVLAPEASRISLHWKGVVPRRIADIAAGAKRSGIEVVFRPAPYTLEELRAFQQRIAKDPDRERVGISLVEIKSTGEGLIVGVRGGAEQAREISSIKSSFIPVEFVTADIQPMARWADSPSFWGGAWIGDGARICTSGFPARRGSGLSTEYFMVTAGHCFGPDLGDIWFAGAGFEFTGLPEGASWSLSTANDGGLINLDAVQFGTPGGGGGQRIYTGGVDPLGQGNGELSQPVKGMSATLAGDTVFSSGAYSGEVSSRVDTNSALWWFTVNGATWMVSGSHARQPQGRGAVGPGDSGGPVFTYTSGGVSARGIVSAVDTRTQSSDCGEEQDRCYTDWFFGHITPLATDLNIVLNTAP